MKDYVVYDLENPSLFQNSICAVGLMLVRDNKVVDKKYSLINPEDEFDPSTIAVHHITPDMVEDSPTLVEYWDEMAPWLTENVVVGHNITYDLRVTSKSLHRYKMRIPDFKYCCTLQLSRRNLKLPSYSLTNIANDLNIVYDAHNAIEDARAAYELYEYINKNDGEGLNNIKLYHFKPRVTEEYDPKLSTNINNLYGMLRVLRFEEDINHEQVDLLKKWIQDNQKYDDFNIFHKTIERLNSILSSNLDSKENREKLLKIVSPVTKSSIYKQSTLYIQVLQGIITSITCNGSVNRDELEKLRTWLLRSNQSLKGVYSYEKILSITEEYLNKENFSSYNQKVISDRLVDLFNPVKATDVNIDFSGKAYCLSGTFKHGNHDEINEVLKTSGLIKKNNISGNVDYLFVGDRGNPAWKFGVIGGKIMQAQKLQDKGSNIEIISESNLFKELNDN